MEDEQSFSMSTSEGESIGGEDKDVGLEMQWDTTPRVKSEERLAVTSSQGEDLLRVPTIQPSTEARYKR
eukprot:scaffold53_cov381-Pavlova_lutheri.AAC.18